ncbi:hypothetical protein LDC_1655, partial [sediment metagenome]
MKNYASVVSALGKLGLSVKENVLLKEYTTFKIGGPCQLLVECAQFQEVLKVVQCLNQHKLPFFLIG